MIATTSDQGLKLIELGLPKSTADSYHPFYDDKLLHQMDDDFTEDYHAFAWSLSALLEVMPKEMLPALEWREGDKEWEANVLVNHNLHFISHYDKLCAVYSMVCWLLEQGLIKKGDNDEQ